MSRAVCTVVSEPGNLVSGVNFISVFYHCGQTSLTSGKQRAHFRSRQAEDVYGDRTVK